MTYSVRLISSASHSLAYAPTQNFNRQNCYSIKITCSSPSVSLSSFSLTPFSSTVCYIIKQMSIKLEFSVACLIQ